MWELFSDHTFRTVLLGTSAIGAISGGLGCFAYLRRQSLIGDIVSHSTLFGIVLFFLASYWLTGTGSKSLFVLIPGAVVAGVAALVLARWINRKTCLKPDAGLGVMLAVFFAPGVLLLRVVQRANPPIPGQRGLQDYLFGMAAAMTIDDLRMIGLLGAVSIGLLILLWKEFKIFTLDPLFAHSLGFSAAIVDGLLLVVMVIGIVVGVQSVGVVLMIALLVTPAAAARQWTRHLGQMFLLASFFGATCGAVGSIASAIYRDLPTGPVIVLTACAIFVVSLVAAPQRGVLARWWSRKQLQRQLAGSAGGQS